MDKEQPLVERYIKRGPFDEPLGASEQTPEINKARTILGQGQ